MNFGVRVLLILAMYGSSAALDVKGLLVDLWRNIDAILATLADMVRVAIASLAGGDGGKSDGRGLPSAGPRRHPVILIPGRHSSRLESKLDKTESNYSECALKQAWETIFLRKDNLEAPLAKCFSENFRLFYNTTTRHTYNQDGVRIRPFRFGDTEGVQYLGKHSHYAYMEQLVVSLVAQNYTINGSLRGAPFDFRKSPPDNVEFVAKLKKLVEETFLDNGNTSVYLVSKSDGGLYALHFLVAQSPSWKAKYIKGFIAIACPWAGAGSAFEVLAVGENLGLLFVAKNSLRDMIVTWSSDYATMPTEAAFPSGLVVSYNGTNYTVHDFEAIFKLYSLPFAMQMYEDSKSLTLDLPHPMVDVYCIHGNGFLTAESFIYDSLDQFPASPRQVKGPGDNVVNQGSLEACRRWSVNPFYKFKHVVIGNATHESILKDSRTFSAIAQILAQ